MRTTKLLLIALALSGCAAPYPPDRYAAAPSAPRPRGPLHVVAEQTIPNLAFPESVGCDGREGVLYVSQFGGTEPKPAEKDGKGFISKLAPDGSVLEQRAFDVTLDKPKGIWIRGERLWVTDIDGVWIFDTVSRKGRKLPIAGAQFANDPTVVGDALFVSDNRGDALFRIEPADFLDEKVQPAVATVFSKKDIGPNGLWPGRDGSLIMVGFGANPGGIHVMARDGSMRTLVRPFGQLDGLYQMPDGSLLFTDWQTGALDHWSESGGLVELARGFKGPADFCVLRDTVYVPDLVKGEVRMLRLG